MSSSLPPVKIKQRQRQTLPGPLPTRGGADPSCGEDNRQRLAEAIFGADSAHKCTQLPPTTLDLCLSPCVRKYTAQKSPQGSFADLGPRAKKGFRTLTDHLPPTHFGGNSPNTAAFCMFCRPKMRPAVSLATSLLSLHAARGYVSSGAAARGPVRMASSRIENTESALSRSALLQQAGQVAALGGAGESERSRRSFDRVFLALGLG